MRTLSRFLYRTVSVSPSLKISLRLSFTIFLDLTHKLLSVLSMLHRPDTNWSHTNTHLFELCESPLLPAPQKQIPQCPSIYISHFLPLVHPTRAFLGPIQQGEMAVACLGWAGLWGGSWGPGGKMGLLAFSANVMMHSSAPLPGWSTVQYFLLT